MTTSFAGQAAGLARLARIALSPEECVRFEQQLGQILTYIETLQRLDLCDVPETVSVEQPNSSLRDDMAAKPFDTEALLALAPRRRGQLVEVPKIKADFSGAEGEGT